MKNKIVALFLIFTFTIAVFALQAKQFREVKEIYIGKVLVLEETDSAVFTENAQFKVVDLQNKELAYIRSLDDTQTLVIRYSDIVFGYPQKLVFTSSYKQVNFFKFRVQ